MDKFIEDLCKGKSIDWLDGFAKGVWAFAHWKDGVQYVGTTGTLLKDIIADIRIIADSQVLRKAGSGKLTRKDVPPPQEANMI